MNVQMIVGPVRGVWSPLSRAVRRKLRVFNGQQSPVFSPVIGGNVSHYNVSGCAIGGEAEEGQKDDAKGKLKEGSTTAIGWTGGSPANRGADDPEIVTSSYVGWNDEHKYVSIAAIGGEGKVAVQRAVYTSHPLNITIYRTIDMMRDLPGYTFVRLPAPR